MDVSTMFEESNTMLSYDNQSIEHSTLGSVSAGDPSTFDLWSDPFSLVQFVVVVVSVLANLGTALTLWVNGDAFSSAILILFRHQSLVDAAFCLVIGLLIFTPSMWLSGNYAIDWFTCHVLHSAFIYSFLVIASTWNLVFISMERYLAVCHPFKHQNLSQTRLIIVIIAFYVFNFIHNAPLFLFQTDFEDNKCFYVSNKSQLGDAMMYAFCIFIFVVDYLVPIVIFVMAYGAVIWTFRKRGKSSEMASSKVIDKASTELTKTAIIVTAIFILTMTFGYWNYLLGNVGAIEYDVSGFSQRFSFWWSCFNSGANPFIYALLIPAYRRSCVKTFCAPCKTAE